MSAFPSLPCFPCPYQASCCGYGVMLSDAEVRDLAARFGEETVYRTGSGEWRTIVRDQRCIFLENNACSLHADPSYPAVCRAFPWTDPETGGPYQYDQTICPEFLARPELVQIGKRGGPPA